jgi:hypothetical protein
MYCSYVIIFCGIWRSNTIGSSLYFNLTRPLVSPVKVLFLNGNGTYVTIAFDAYKHVLGNSGFLEKSHQQFTDTR